MTPRDNYNITDDKLHRGLSHITKLFSYFSWIFWFKKKKKKKIPWQHAWFQIKMQFKFWGFNWYPSTTIVVSILKTIKLDDSTKCVFVFTSVSWLIKTYIINSAKNHYW